MKCGNVKMETSKNIDNKDISKYDYQGFPYAVYTLGGIPPHMGEVGQVQGDKALIGGGLIRGDIDLMGGT